MIKFKMMRSGLV